MDRRWRDGGVLSGLLALVWVCAFRLRDVHADDAGIVLRYARNLVDGHGWVYNAGEPVNATTSPLHVVVSAAVGAMVGDWRSVPAITLALGLSGAVVVVWSCVRPYGPLPAAVAALLAAVAPAIYTTLGLESALLVAAGLATTAAWSRRRFAAAGLGWGLAFLARPDAFLLGPLLYGHDLLAGRFCRRGAAVATGTAAVTVLPWLAFAWLRFGSPLPNTLAIKVAQRRFFGDGSIYIDGFWRELAAIDSRGVGVGAALPAALLASGLVWLAVGHRRLPAPALFAAWALVQFAVYAAFDLPPYHWYYAPLLFALALGTGALLTSAWDPQRRPLRSAATLLLACAQIAVAFPEVVAPRPTLPHYRQVGAWLAANTPADAGVACADIGIVGFAIGQRRLVDMQGLVTPGAAAAIAGGATDWWFDAHTPDYVVFHDPPWRAFEAPVLARADFQRAYRPVPVPVRGITVWRRLRAASERAAPGTPPQPGW